MRLSANFLLKSNCQKFAKKFGTKSEKAVDREGSPMIEQRSSRWKEAGDGRAGNKEESKAEARKKASEARARRAIRRAINKGNKKSNAKEQ